MSDEKQSLLEYLNLTGLLYQGLHKTLSDKGQLDLVHRSCWSAFLKEGLYDPRILSVIHSYIFNLRTAFSFPCIWKDRYMIDKYMDKGVPLYLRYPYAESKPRYVISFCASNRYIYAVIRDGDNKYIYVWDIDNWNELPIHNIAPGYNDNIETIAIAPDQQTLCTLSYDDIKIWDCESTGNLILRHTLKPPAQTLYRMSYSLDSKYIYLLSGASHNTLLVYHVQTGVFEHSYTDVRGFDICCAGDHLYIGRINYIQDRDYVGQLVGKFPDILPDDNYANPPLDATYMDRRISDGTRLLALASFKQDVAVIYTNRLEIYRTGQLHKTIPFASMIGIPRQMCYSPNGRYIAVLSCRPENVTVWEVDTPRDRGLAKAVNAPANPVFQCYGCTVHFSNGYGTLCFNGNYLIVLQHFIAIYKLPFQVEAPAELTSS